jgi:large subunit ribosomal protein L22
MEAKAEAKWVRMGPRKLRRIVNELRGKPAQEALVYLKFLPQRGARILLKTIQSAVANAKNNFKMKEDRLWISKAYINEAPMYKRMQPRSRGRGFPIKKRNSHVMIVVEEAK